MNFWIIAVILLAVSAAAISWPLFTGSVKDRIVGVLISLVIPIAGLILYQNIGTPEAIGIPAATPQQSAQSQQQQGHSSQQAEMDDMVAQLQQRMTENPDDLDGWLILGRTLKTMQRYQEALNALTNANRLVPGTPMVMIELAEARLFASGQSEIPADVTQLIESALEIDPHQQKGLWLLGIAAAQQQDEARAIEIWQTLLAELDPASPSATRVAQQIEMTQASLGQAEVTNADIAETEVAVTEVASTETPVAATTVAESGIPVTITIAGDLANSVPADAALFIFIHPSGGAGMPLAVKRVAARGFPVSLNFSDADLLRPGTSLQDFEQLDISARISMAGIANRAPGDFQANKISLDTKAVKPIALHLDQRVP